MEDWGEPDSMTLIEKFPTEKTVPGNLYGEKWKVIWTRSHVWRHYYVVEYACSFIIYTPCYDEDGEPSICSEEVWKTCSRTDYYENTATDTRTDVVSISLRAKETSRTDIHLDLANRQLSSSNDVDNVFNMKKVSFFDVHNDPQLEEAYLKYKSDVFDPNKEGNIKNQGFSGEDLVMIYSSGYASPYEISVPGWVELEVKNAVDEISEEIRKDIHLSPDINYITYPVPSELLIAARDDLIRKIERNESGYIDRGQYYSDGHYTSASAKAISSVREWYVDEVKYQIREMFTSGSSQVDNMILKNFSEPEKVKQANRDGAKLLSEGLKLPFGVSMMAHHVDAEGNVYPKGELEAWNESVTLMLDQEPNYLSAERPYGKEMLYTLKLRNNNLLGGTGVHVLPTLDPWITTVNAWSIDVEGEFVKFEVLDMDNEVHPNPIFGHEPQVYRREERTIKDKLNNFVPLGDNVPIRFNFTTGTFLAVPPSKIEGVGDKDWVIVEESAGYKVKK